MRRAFQILGAAWVLAAGTAEADFAAPPFVLYQACQNVISWNSPTNPYYSINIPVEQALPIALPAGDTLNIISSSPSSLQASVDYSGPQPLVKFVPLAPHSNPHCAPYDQYVMVWDSQGLYSAVMIVDTYWP